MPTHYSRIIAAVDGSEDSSRAATVAAGLARDMNRPLTLLYVFPAPERNEFVSIDTLPGAMHPETLSPEVLDQAKREAGTKVFAKARQAIGGDSVEIEERVAIGTVVPEILRAAEELKPALLVVGRRGLGRFSEVMLGSVSNKLVHQGSVPVLVV
jgi:nucleotide-binding universal stress UspA family protein